MDDFRQMISLDGPHQRRHHHLGPHRRRGHPRPELDANCAHAVDQPAVAYDILGALSQAACRRSQLTAQITRYLDQALAAGKLGHDRGEDPALAVEGAVIFLDDARLSAAALAGDLDAAQQQLALINGRGHRTPQDQP